MGLGKPVTWIWESTQERHQFWDLPGEKERKFLQDKRTAQAKPWSQSASKFRNQCLKSWQDTRFLEAQRVTGKWRGVDLGMQASEVTLGLAATVRLLVFILRTRWSCQKVLRGRVTSKICGLEVPIMAQRKQIQLGTMRLWV